MAIRRSARLRGRQSEEPPADPNNHTHNNATDNNTTANKLPSVMERDEPPVHDFPPVPNHDPSAHTPRKLNTPHKSTVSSSPAKTPTSALARPPHTEMHPSKVQQSTTKQADSGLILGFNPVKKDANGAVIRDSVVQNTPTKTKARAEPASASKNNNTPYGTPFEFRFATQESELSEEAKKLMETVREDAAKIKSRMVQEQGTRGSESSQHAQADRKFAHPKGKAGRFSDVHMAEFKKMDSIAGHASAFRATPGRFQPVEKTLKRTNSKARLDEPDSNNSPSKAPIKSSPAPPAGKRAKHDQKDDTSTSRLPQAPRTVSPAKPTSSRPRPRSTIRSSLMTPTKSSSARSTASASMKPPRTTMIPSLTRSPAAKASDAPRTPRTEFNPRFKSNIPTLGNLKSILRRHQPLFSKDPAKIAAGTHVAAPDFQPDFKPAMLFGSDHHADELSRTPSPKKRVEFTASTTEQSERPPESPSPSKAPASSRLAASDITYPTLPTLTPEKPSDEARSPSIRHVRSSDVNTDSSLPDIPGKPHGIGHKKPQPEPATSTAPQQSSLPDIAGIPHGIGHRKRLREPNDTDMDVDTENVPPAEPTEPRSVKRAKFTSPTSAKVPTSPSPVKAKRATATSQTPLRGNTVGRPVGNTPASERAKKSRGVLSLSRLHMLAQPKSRS